MKKIILIVVLCCAIVTVKAQVAVVNSKKIVASVKEFAKIDTLVIKETSSYQPEFNKKQQQLNQLVIIADSLSKIDAKSEATIKAIANAQALDKDLKSYVEQSNKKIEDYRNLLTKPYTEKVMTAIKAVATRGKYMQVLDSASINMLYLNPLSDITEQVIKELKIK